VLITNKTRIRSLKANLGNIKIGSKFVVGISNLERYESILKEIGFTDDLEVGESVLPTISGPISEYNAIGTYIKHKDQPMETAYTTVFWSWEQWAGRGHTETHSDYRDRPYKRYPRTFISPPSIELTISETDNGNKVVISPIIEYNNNDEDFLHIINLFLEIFQECQIFTENLDEIVITPTKRLNWEILPKGPMPWDKLLENVGPIIKRAPNHPVVLHRIHKINNFNPDFRAIGKAGFNGYIVFGFKKKGIYIFESMMYGNATYIFDENWEELSKKTKAEILDKNLQKYRIIHRANWDNEINRLFV
jgi:hypothetical protein